MGTKYKSREHQECFHCLFFIFFIWLSLLPADVFSSYAKLKTEASEAALRDFLTTFKNNAEQIQYAVETLTPPMNQEREGKKVGEECKW